MAILKSYQAQQGQQQQQHRNGNRDKFVLPAVCEERGVLESLFLQKRSRCGLCRKSVVFLVHVFGFSRRKVRVVDVSAASWHIRRKGGSDSTVRRVEELCYRLEPWCKAL